MSICLLCSLYEFEGKCQAGHTPKVRKSLMASRCYQKTKCPDYARHPFNDIEVESDLDKQTP